MEFEKFIGGKFKTSTLPNEFSKRFHDVNLLVAGVRPLVSHYLFIGMQMRNLGQYTFIDYLISDCGVGQITSLMIVLCVAHKFHDVIARVHVYYGDGATVSDNLLLITCLCLPMLIYAGCRSESDEARRHFHWVRQFLFLFRGSPICSALFLKLKFKTNINFFICIILCSIRQY
jgi:hypothetical protein